MDMCNIKCVRNGSACTLLSYSSTLFLISSGYRRILAPPKVTDQIFETSVSVAISR